ncbi:MAG: DUF5011 domain-containing protein [Firmicutes bacterium]|nr:DUF5011 domain-containing protein [Bacillota bacterium]
MEDEKEMLGADEELEQVNMPDAETPAEPDLFEKEYVISDETKSDGPTVVAEEPPKKAPVKKEKKKGSKKALVIGLIIFALLAAAFAGWYFLRPGIRFSTTRPTAEAGEEFDAMSIVEGVRGGELSDIAVYGPKGELAKGVYKYSYSFKGREYEITVTVKDTKAPELSIKPEDEMASFNDREEVDPAGIVNVKDYGKVTLKLDDQGNDLKTPGMYEVIVTATDEDGNESKIPAVIKIEPYDTEGPKIEGATNTSVILWSSFDLMAGVKVTDDKDPNPSLVVDSGGFTTSAEGSYKVTYTAKDSYGNETVVERWINVYQVAYYTPGYDSSVYWDATGEWGQPYLVAVNRSHNTVTVYGKDGNGNYTVPVRAMACSTARPGYNTPVSTNVPGGRFHSAWRADWCYMVDGSWGRYAISIDTSLAPDPNDTWGIMFHSVCYYSQSIDNLEYEEYNKLGGTASLGCIRMCVADELWLYNNCPEGFPIVIYDDPSSPGPLGKPDPIRIDVNDPRRGWDPTDPSGDNPW